MKSIVIDREKWLHGEGPRNSFLIRVGDDKMCCLGFVGLACGIPKARLLGKKSPIDTYGTVASRKHWPKGLLEQGGGLDSSTATLLMSHNDACEPAGGERGRERRIKTLFQKIGLTVTFTGRRARDHRP